MCREKCRKFVCTAIRKRRSCATASWVWRWTTSSPKCSSPKSINSREIVKQEEDKLKVQEIRDDYHMYKTVKDALGSKYKKRKRQYD